MGWRDNAPTLQQAENPNNQTGIDGVPECSITSETVVFIRQLDGGGQGELGETRNEKRAGTRGEREARERERSESDGTEDGRRVIVGDPGTATFTRLRSVK